jgi:hypothetical protein
MSFLHERYSGAARVPAPNEKVLANVTEVSTTRIFTHLQSPNCGIEFRLSRMPYT